MDVKEKGHNAPAEDNAKILIPNELANNNDDKSGRDYLSDIDNELRASSIAVDEHLIDISRDYGQPDYTMYRGGVGTMPKGDIVAVKAKSKNGKTFLCTIFAAAILGDRNFGFTGVNSGVCKVVYIDTEQNLQNTAALVKRIHSLLGWDIQRNNERLIAYNLRTMDIPKRYPFVAERTRYHHPTLTIIDGIADLISDFNDISQSSETINKLMQLSSDNNACVVCVLHTNKAANDNQMKGHLGTLLLQKAAEVWEVKKEGYTFNVSQTETRNQPADDFSFQIDWHGIPYATASEKEVKERKKVDEAKALISQAFGDSTDLSYSELANRISKSANCSDRTAQRKIKEAKEKGWLSDDGKNYKIRQ